MHTISRVRNYLSVCSVIKNSVFCKYLSLILLVKNYVLSILYESHKEKENMYK